jgi:hypothetical protein
MIQIKVLFFLVHVLLVLAVASYGFFACELLAPVTSKCSVRCRILFFERRVEVTLCHVYVNECTLITEIKPKAVELRVRDWQTECAPALARRRTAGEIVLVGTWCF